MRVSANDIHAYYQPQPCERRLYLRETDVPEEEPGPFEQVLIELGMRHEQAHLATLGTYVDLSGGSLSQRADETRSAIADGAPVIYQGVLFGTLPGSEQQLALAGSPDYLIRTGDGYRIRDSKVARRINEKDHPEVLRQLELYHLLYESTFGVPPRGLEVHSGAGDIVPVAPDQARALPALLREIGRLKSATSDPVVAVQWSKCSTCGFGAHCWEPATSVQDVAIVPGVEQKMALALYDLGVRTAADLLDQFNEASLAEFQFPRGTGLRRVGRTAERILISARAIVEGVVVSIAPLDLRSADTYVMFDLEGVPPQLNDLEKIYLWGLQLYGDNPGPYRAAVAGFGADGDREGWFGFLDEAEAILGKCGDVPFVHWWSYETIYLRKYIERYGDRDGIATRVLANCLDLLKVTQAAVALPLPSYSLKVVEKFVGFKRSLQEGKGDWSIAKYVEATELEDEDARQTVMDEILAYNEEDLAATWAVLEWLRSHAA